MLLAIMPVRGEVMTSQTAGHPAAAVYPFAVVLSFLLVFRTSQAYLRWWEGRSAIALFVSRFGTVSLCLLSMTHDQALRNEILRLMLLTNAIVFENLRGDTKGTGQTENAHLALNDESGMIKTSDQETLVCAAI